MDIREKRKMVYQITVVGVKKKPIVIDIATSEPSFQNMTIGELKIILKDKLPGRHVISNTCRSILSTALIPNP